MLKPRAQRRPAAAPGPVARGTDSSKYGSKSGLLRSPIALILLAGVLLFVLIALFQFAKMEQLVDGSGSSARSVRGSSENGLGLDPLLALPAEIAGEGPAVVELDEEQEREEWGRLRAQERLVEWLDDDSGIPVGYVRVPRIPAGKRTGDDLKLHVIFSSGCNWFQHWQSELLMATADMVGQRGRVTRIVSGCHDKSAETVRHTHQTFPAGNNDKLVPLELLNRSVNENFGLFITPSFEGAKDFPWINKPSSINYFLQHARDELDRLGETVIAILDPDFVFLKPLTQTGSLPQDVIQSRGSDGKENDPVDVVREGRPVAQRYGLEGHWIKRFPVKEITGDPNSPALRYSSREAARYFSVGPPLILHVNDITELAVLWEKYMRPVLAIDSDILADMWAYSIGSAHLELHHTILDHYMISTWGRTGQAYSWVDAWRSMSCLNPKASPHDKFPTFIHLASNFKAPESKEWMFHKGHVPADILSCDSPLIVESPDDLFNISPHKDHRNQHAWVLCHTVAKLNEVLLRYKRKFCPPGFEQRKLVRLIQRKTKDKRCSQSRDKWCYPLAQIEGLPDNWRETL